MGMGSECFTSSRGLGEELFVDMMEYEVKEMEERGKMGGKEDKQDPALISSASTLIATSITHCTCHSADTEFSNLDPQTQLTNKSQAVLSHKLAQP